MEEDEGASAAPRPDGGAATCEEGHADPAERAFGQGPPAERAFGQGPGDEEPSETGDAAGREGVRHESQACPYHDGYDWDAYASFHGCVHFVDEMPVPACAGGGGGARTMPVYSADPMRKQATLGLPRLLALLLGIWGVQWRSWAAGGLGGRHGPGVRC